MSATTEEWSSSMIITKHYQKPIFNLEAYMLINDVINGDNHIAGDPEKGILKDRAQKIKKALEGIRRELTVKDISLFTNFQNTQASIASCLLESFIKIIHIDDDDFIDKAVKKIEQFFTEPLSSISISRHLEMTYDQKKNDPLSETLKLRMNDHDKIELIKALREPQVYLTRIFAELSPLSEKLKKIANEYDFEISDKLDQDIIDFVFKNINYRYEGILTIVPSLYKYDSLIANIDDRDGGVTLLIGIALDFDNIRDFYFYDNMDQRIEYFVKAISDRSKMKIIEILKEKEAYNAQLADALGLKAPTISHHIDQMLNAGIISARRVNDRTYFRFNREKCLLIIDNLRKKFE